MESNRAAESKEKKSAQPVASAILRDGSMVELLYRPNTRSTAFAVYADGDWRLERRIASDDGTLLVPFSPENNLIKNEAVLLPSEPADYGTDEQLLSDIQLFLHRYVDLSATFEQVATCYVLLTWLYDAFNELPYLRLRGDFGTGKTRTLLVVGSICNKPFFASGASTVSPIFHTLNAFGGTLIFDEADFRFSDERAEIVKILNNGNVRGLPVLRTMINRQREFNPQAFRVYGPKIVATRSSYEDRGLESRFLTEEMGTRTLRPDIPINMPEAFKEEARELRNKLLLYRFRRRPLAKLNESLVDPQLEARLNQILVPLLSVVEDKSVRERLRWMAHSAQADLVAERGLQAESHVLEIVASLMSTTQHLFVRVADIAAALIEKYGVEYDRPITNRWVGGILRRRLNLRTYKTHGNYVVSLTERDKVALLCARYGITLEDHNVPQDAGDVGTSGTTQHLL